MKANYIIKADVDGFPLVIQDIGPWDKHLSVTNDVETVIIDLHKRGLIGNGRPLYYIDSEGQMDEIQYDENKDFVGFRILTDLQDF